MKKLFAAIAFSALIFGGFFFADKPVETASELEPPILPTFGIASFTDPM